MVTRTCSRVCEDGHRCGTYPRRGSDYCLWHDPKLTAEAAEARKLGGLRRKRERTVAAAYDLQSLGSVEGIRRILEIAMIDALSQDNSIARVRVLIAGALAAAKLLETVELEQRITALEAAAAKPVGPIEPRRLPRRVS